MNKVILVGNLTRDPEQTETPSGVAVCRFAIAVSRDYANADGNKETDFFNITVWRNKAESCGKYLKKGNKVAIVGSLQNRSYPPGCLFRPGGPGTAGCGPDDLRGPDPGGGGTAR